MKWYNTIIGILAIVLVASAGVVVFSGENNKVDTEEQSKALENVITETGRNGDDIKKSLGARTILLPTPVWAIGSYDKEGKPNVMTAAWVGICCSKPPCVTVSLRKATYTFGNIMERKAFTVNIPSELFAKEIAYFGRVSGRDVDKFSATGLTAIKSALVDAPYIEEFPFVIECKLLHTFKLGLHTMFIGEIMDVKANESILGEDGLPDIEKLKPFVFAPGSSNFYRTGEYLGKVSSLAQELKPIQLLKPQMDNGRPLMQVLKDRRSSRAFSTEKLPMQVLSNMLWAAFGVNRPDSGKRTAPSASNRQEIDIYVATADGLYLYDAKAHTLKPVLAEDIRAVTGRQPFVQQAPVNLIYVADFSRMGKATADGKVFYSAADTGFISQNVYLYCTSEGLATVVRGLIDRPALAKVMRLRPDQKVILAQSVGYPKK